MGERHETDLIASDTGRRRCIELALVLAVFFIEGGAPAPHVNESHYLTKARHYWDPSFCPGDFFLDSADAHLVFYWTIGWLTKWMSLPAVAWVGRLAAWTLLAVGWTRLVRVVTGFPGAAVLSAAVWVALVDHFNFAGEWAVGGVEAKCFAYGFVLLGLAAIARGDWRTPWPWFGVAAAFHVLVGGWAALAAGGAWLAEPRDRRPALSSLTLPLTVGAALSLPGLLPALHLDRGVPAATVHEAARIYVFDRLPHHLAPLTLAEDEIRARFVRFGALGIAFLALWAWTAQRSNEAASGGWRTDGLLRIIGVAALAWLAGIVGLALEWILADRPLLAASVLRYYWFRLGDVALPLAVALGTAALLVEAWRVATKWAAPLVMIVAIAVGGHLIGIVATRWQQPWPPAAARLADFASWRSACEWIRDHAPPDAVCVIPRDAYSFKWFAERADIVNWKDIPQDASGLVEWRRRMDDLYTVGVDYAGQPILLGSPEQWTARRSRAIAERYGARYVVARIDPPLALRRVYPPGAESLSDWYAVYDMDPAAPQASPKESQPGSPQTSP
jgi:hypothetical protein